MILNLTLGVLLIAVSILLTKGFLQRSQLITFVDILILSVTLYFSAGWLSSGIWGSNSHSLYLVSDYNLSIFLIVALYIIGIKGGWIFASKIIKIKSRQFQSTLKALPIVIPRTETISFTNVLAVYISAWILRLYMAIAFGIFFSGTGKAGLISKIPYSFTIIYSLFNMLSLGCLLWASITIWTRSTRRKKWVYNTALFVILGEGAWAFLKGRRWMISWAIFLVIGYVLAGKKVNMKVLGTGVITALLFVTIIFPKFLTTRNNYDWKNQSALNAFHEAATKSIEKESALNKSLYYENMQSRSMGLHRFIAHILSSQERRTPMYGDAFIRIVYRAIPSILLPGKYGNLAVEQAIQHHYGIKFHDVAVSMPTVAVADFGVIGSLIYGVLIGIYLYILNKAISKIKIKHPFVAMSLCGGTIMTLFMVEDDPVGFILLLRNITIIYIAVLLFPNIPTPAPRLRRSPIPRKNFKTISKLQQTDSSK